MQGGRCTVASSHPNTAPMSAHAAVAGFTWQATEVAGGRAALDATSNVQKLRGAKTHTPLKPESRQAS